MRKAMLLALVVCLVVPAVSFCQVEAEEAAAVTDTGKEMKMHKGMMKGEAAKEGMQKKHAMMGMMEKMMKKEIIATSDGGAIVLFGNTLYKYDKDLNLVKKTEIEIDYEAMKKKMHEMKEKCFMHKKMEQEKEEITSE